MKILLVSVPIEFPLAAYCLAAHTASSLRDCVVELIQLDWSRLSSEMRKNAEIWRYVEQVQHSRPDIVGFSVYMWNHTVVRELIAITGRVFPRLKILVGGPELATPEAAESWFGDALVSAAVRGEGERTLVEVVERMAQGDGVEEVQGTSWWDGSKVVHEPDRRLEGDFLPYASPYLEGWIPPNLFYREGSEMGPHMHRRAPLETYRGCYMSCSYCQWGIARKRIPFPETRVKRELSWLLSNRVQSILIFDSMFGCTKRSAKSLLEHVISEKRRIGVQTRLILYHNQDFFDPELFDLYREAGALVEIDLQSTNPEVLNRLGRSRWTTESFERHLAALGEQTTGIGDLMIGIPGDSLKTFEESVDYMLRHGLRVNLFHASVLPGTGWSRTIEEDGTVSSPIPPRAVFCNSTFPLNEMIAARILGHGIEFFNDHPWTARYLWRTSFDRPVDLCRAFGDAVYERLGIMYEESQLYGETLFGKEETVAAIVRDLCGDSAHADLIVDLFTLEAALHRMSNQYLRERFEKPFRLKPFEGWNPSDSDWLKQRPRFRGEFCEQFILRYRVDELVDRVRDGDPLLPLDKVRKEPIVALVFNDGNPWFVMVDGSITYRLLQRFNGFFTVEECLDNMDPEWRTLDDLSPLWRMLSHLASTGLIGPRESGQNSI